MSIQFITTYQVEVFTENMFGEMQRYVDTFKADSIDDLTELVFEKYGELDYVIMAQRTYAEPILN